MDYISHFSFRVSSRKNWAFFVLQMIFYQSEVIPRELPCPQKFLVTRLFSKQEFWKFVEPFLKSKESFSNYDVIENGKELANTFSNRFTSIAEKTTGIPLENKFNNLEDDTGSVKSINKQYKNLLIVFEIEINLLNQEDIFEFSKVLQQVQT